MLNQGVVQQVGTPRELFDRPANLFVATFIGSPAMNILPANGDGSSATLVDTAGEIATHHQGAFRLGVRPTDWVVGGR